MDHQSRLRAWSAPVDIRFSALGDLMVRGPYGTPTTVYELFDQFFWSKQQVGRYQR